MAPKGRGSGNTPARVVDLVNDAISKTSLRSVSKTTGLGLAALSRYSKGIGEPAQSTLEKLGIYFGVSVAWLRGDTDDFGPMKPERVGDLAGVVRQRMIDILEINALIPDRCAATFCILVVYEMRQIKGITKLFGMHNIELETLQEIMDLIREVDTKVIPRERRLQT